MKLHSLSSLIFIKRTKIPSGNKITIGCKNKSINKTKLLRILKSYSSVDILKLNSANSSWRKKINVYKAGEKFVRSYSAIQTVHEKTFILTFKHAADRSLFLSEIALE